MLPFLWWFCLTNFHWYSRGWFGSGCSRGLWPFRWIFSKRLSYRFAILCYLISTSIDAKLLFQILHRKESNVSISCPSSRGQSTRAAWTPAYRLDCCFMLVESHHLVPTFHRVNCQFVVVSSWCDIRTVWTPLQATDLLRMGFVAVNLANSWIPYSNITISRSTC